MKSADVISTLKQNGWYQVDQKGSHVQLKHPDKAGHVTVPHPKRDIPHGTLCGIESNQGWG
jgi:predicted RNA binding protein YcfA (HicA-like mRNA interferase family)